MQPAPDPHAGAHRAQVEHRVGGPMHLQDVDMKASAAAPSRAGGPAKRGGGRYPQVAVGHGSIDWVQTFTAAKVGGVKNYFVEQNWELTQQSVAYLKTLKV